MLAPGRPAAAGLELCRNKGSGRRWRPSPMLLLLAGPYTALLSKESVRSAASQRHSFLPAIAAAIRRGS